MRLNNRGNWSLIGLLVVVVIVGVVAAVYLGGRDSTTTVANREDLLDPESAKQTTVGRSMDTAKAVDCRERLRQIRLGIDNYRLSSEANAPSLKDAGLGVSTDYFYCPVSGKPYSYAPAGGQVACPTHASY